MAQLLAVLFIMVLSVLTGVAAMWYGYGIAVQSWAAIIVCTLIQGVLYAILSAVSKD